MSWILGLLLKSIVLLDTADYPPSQAQCEAIGEEAVKAAGLVCSKNAEFEFDKIGGE